MKTANLAIVFTDIKGFTERTSRQTLEQNQQLLQTHADLLRPLFSAFGGRVVKSIGDAFLVTFESPTQAVLCGVAIQDRLWDHNRVAADTDRLDVRVAVNVGEVRLDSNDVFGEPVNIAARVEHIAEAGEVFFTEAVYLAMNKAEVPSVEVGAFELKGIPGKIRVFKVPRAPYRVTPAGIPAPAETGEQPPFGNLGLSRVQDSLRTEKFINLNEAAARVGATASALGQRAGALGGGFLDRTRSLTPGQRRTFFTIAAGGAAFAFVIVLIALLSASPLERAVMAVEEAPRGERDTRIREVQRLISEEQDPAEALYGQGRLDEVLGAPARAARAYGEAAKKGSGAAESRLVGLLDHPECRVRAAAADVARDYRLEGARGALEDLAESGGPGEQPGLFGCSSRKAAEQALEALR